MATQLPKSMTVTPDVPGRAAPSRFAFASSKDGSFVLDSATGQSWILKVDGNDVPHWSSVAYRDSGETFEAVLSELTQMINTETSTEHLVHMLKGLRDAAVSATNHL